MLDENSLYPDTVTNRLVKRAVLDSEETARNYVDKWSFPVCRYSGHIYASLSELRATLFTRSQL